MRDDVPARAVRNPFPGLRPFCTDEEHLFFGRESQVDRMIDKLAAHRFLAVVGTSGSGKSSLVNCGLRPALHRGYMTSAGSSWRMAQFRPGGSDPIGALAQELAAPGVLFEAWDNDGLTARELVETTLRLGSLGLVDIVEQARLPEGMQLLVVVDQFEELFRFRSLAADAAMNAHGPTQDAVAFVKLLLEAPAQANTPIYVVLTMRSDFLGECAQFLSLADAINDGQYLVPRLTRQEIRAAIEGPVGVGEATITPVLVTRLLNDVGDNPDQLSILQHALNRTWANWENECKAQGPLDLLHYEAVGGMADALNRHAERAFSELGSDERKRLAERIFKALTDKSTDPRGIRRPTPLEQLCAICGATRDKVESVLEAFRKPSRSFLMPPAGETLEADTVIDISHESLMRLWGRLKGWGDEEAESARAYRRLSETAMLWRRYDTGLLRDPVLRLTLEWRAKYQPNVAWAAQYQGAFDFDSADNFLKDRGEVRAADECDTGFVHRWFATRWNDAIAFLDHSRDAQNRENLEAEIERRWLASWWRYQPFGMMTIVFIASTLSLRNMLTENDLNSRTVKIVPFFDWSPIFEIGELVFPAVGMLAVFGYILMAPYSRRLFDKKARADIEREGDAYATFGRRAVAHVLDWIVSYLLLAIIVLAIIGSIAAIYEGTADILILIVLVPWLYHAWSLSSKHQATPGMWIAGLIATDVQGRRLSFLRATARYFASLLSYCTALIGFLMQPFNKRRQTLHDYLCSTVVVLQSQPLHDRPGTLAGAVSGIIAFLTIGLLLMVFLYIIVITSVLPLPSNTSFNDFSEFLDWLETLSNAPSAPAVFGLYWTSQFLAGFYSYRFGTYIARRYKKFNKLSLALSIAIVNIGLDIPSAMADYSNYTAEKLIGDVIQDVILTLGIYVAYSWSRDPRKIETGKSIV